MSRLLSILFLVLNVYDWVLTKICIQHGGIEVNYLPKLIFSLGGINGLLVYKILVGFGIIYLFRNNIKYISATCIAMGIVCIYMTICVLSSF